jgi:YihY family inner membrane protein
MALSQPQHKQPEQSDWQPRLTRPLAPQGEEQGKKKEQEAKKALGGLKAFWAKINNDWVFNLAAMLAYNLLMSIVPILALILSIFGLFLNSLAPGSEQQLINQISAAIPGGSNFVKPALSRLAAGSGIFAVISIVLSAWFGSRLFIAIAQCFDIIYRLPTRGFIRQNSIALGMMFIFVVLIPVLLAVSVAPSFLSTTFVGHLLNQTPAASFWLAVATGFVGFVVASILFLAIYSVLPNRPLRIRDAWKGALVAGALLEVYTIAFPFYATTFLKPNSYGATAGFAVLILVFFYYFGIILLLGAEINSFLAGQRQTVTSLPGVLYEVQVRKSVEGAAGPTAGQPQEDLQSDRAGLDFTMTPAPDMLHPPSKEEEAQRIQQRAEQKRQEETTRTGS